MIQHFLNKNKVKGNKLKKRKRIFYIVGFIRYDSEPGTHITANGFEMKNTLRHIFCKRHFDILREDNGL